MQQDHLERKRTNPGVDKEAIEIPEPAPRKISLTERILAIVMSGDRQQAYSRGLVGKPLLYIVRGPRYQTFANGSSYFTSVFVSLGVFLFGYDQGVMSGIITFVTSPDAWGQR